MKTRGVYLPDESKDNVGRAGDSDRAGLFPLQQACLVIGHLWYEGDAGLRRRLVQTMHTQGATLAGVRAVLREYAASIGEAGDGGREAPAAPYHKGSIRQATEPPAARARRGAMHGAGRGALTGAAPSRSTPGRAC